MKKKVLSLVLVITIILGVIPFGYAANTTPYISNGEYVYAITSDDATNTANDITDLGFGKGSNNGKIWTDKTVKANASGFDVTLSALSQEYVATSTKMKDATIAADVVFILDFTSSMTSDPKLGSIYRLEALANAFNISAKIISEANPNNRMQVFSYCCDGANSKALCNEIMPLGVYKSTTGKFFTYSSKQISVLSGSGVTKDGKAFTLSAQSTKNYTCSQYGIANGVYGLIKNINNDTTGTINRKPYVIFMTDGGATVANSKWYQDDSTKLNNGDITGDRNTSTKEIAAATILTANLWKEKLQSAYNKYNSTDNKQDKTLQDVTWFNIGIGVTEKQYPFVDCVLDPSKAKESGSSYSSVKTQISTYMSNAKTAGYKGTDYSQNDGFVYCSFCKFCETESRVTDAFTELANEIQKASAQKNIPVYSYESAEISSDLVFTDVVGDGMVIDSSSFSLNVPVLNKDTNVKTLSTVSATYDSSNKIYTFTGYNTTVKVNGQTITWTIPAEEVAMFEFKDRGNLSSASSFDSSDYIASDPISLTYRVKSPEELANKNYYSNAFKTTSSVKTANTEATYNVPGDNPYYFNLTINKTTGKTDSSTLKTDVVKTKEKSKNVTDTAKYIYESSFDVTGNGGADAVCEVSTKLGNNGKIEPVLQLSKSVDRSVSSPDSEYIYTVTVKNLTDSKNGINVPSVVISDKLPSGVSFIAGETGVTYENGAIKIVAGEISKGSTVTYKYIVKVDSTAKNNDVIKSYDPIFTNVNKTTMGTSFDTTTNDALDVTIETINISLKKEWVGDKSEYEDATVTFAVKNGSKIVTSVDIKGTSWTGEAKGLPKYFAEKEALSFSVPDNAIINYTVVEIKGLDEYTASDAVKNDTDGSYTITNTRNSNPTFSIPVEKVWDGPSVDQEEVTIYLKQNGKDFKDIKLNSSEESKWKGTFTDIPTYNTTTPNDWVKYVYTFTESTLSKSKDYKSPVFDYDAADLSKGVKVTNERNNHGTVQITVNKVWDTPEADKNTVQVKVYKASDTNKTALDTLTLSQDGNWTATSKALDKYDSKWNEIEYAVEELSVPDYITATYENTGNVFTVTNTRTKMGKVNISVEKEWKGPANEATTVTVQLYKGLGKSKEVVKDKTLSLTAKSLEGEFNDLPQYEKVEDTWSEIQYSVAETNCPSTYTNAVTGTAKDGFKITNTRINENIKVTVKKTWKGLTTDRKPIVVTLIADGTSTKAEKTLNEANNWIASFENVKKYNETTWKEVVYTVTEDFESEDYNAMTQSCEQNKNDTGKTITIVNERKDGDAIVEVSVSKTWVGPKKDKQEVVVTLLKGGNKTSTTLKLNESNFWSSNFEKLPKYDKTTNDWTVITYGVEETTQISGYSSSVAPGTTANSFVITNSKNDGDTVTVEVNKVWDTPEADKKTVKVKVYDKADKTKTALDELTLSNDGSWKATSKALPKYDKTTEVWTEINYAVEELNVPDYITATYKNTGNVFTVTNTRTKMGETKFSVKKEWVGPSGEAKDVTIQLYKGSGDSKQIVTGKTITLTPTNLEGEFTGLDKYQKVSNVWSEIEYTVAETNCPSNYNSAVSGSAAAGYKITNTRINEKTEVKVVKKWIGLVGDRKEIVVSLYIGEKDTGKTVKLNAAGGWTATFTNLDKYETTNWTEINYTVKEDFTSEFYKAVDIKSVAYEKGNGKTITLTNERNDKDATIVLPVEKVWVGPVSERKEVTVTLLKNSQETKTTLKLNDENEWKSTFKKLPKYDTSKDDWTVITYTVSESIADTSFPASKYTKNIAYDKGTATITNTRNTNDTVTVNFSKQWVGPIEERENITVTLLKNGNDTTTTKTLSTGNWTGSFDNLPMYDTTNADWTVITYSVKESFSNDKYDSAVTPGTTANSFVITNTRKSNDEIDIPVTKVWDGPTSEQKDVTVTLYNADGATPVVVTSVDAITLTTGKWSDTFEDLPKYNTSSNDWTVIKYTVDESITDESYPASKYTKTIQKNNDGSFTIKNERNTNDYINIPVTKKWIGPAEEQVSVTISLYADEIDTTKDLTLTKTQLSSSFTNLEKYDKDWNEIVYTVKEDTISNASFPNAKYKAFQVSGDITNGFTVTNERNTNDYVMIPVEKVWVGPSDEKIAVEVELVANSVATGKKLALNNDNSWKSEFTGIPKYDTTNDTWTVIAYNVNENTTLSKYDIEVTDNKDYSFTVTNTRKQDYININVEKKWVGEATQSLTVYVYADSKQEYSAVLSADNDWKTTFNDVPVFDADWDKIVYTVGEESLNGYKQYDIESKDNSFVITNEQAKKITYVFEGNYPEGKTPPEDNNIYYSGDPYEVKDDLFKDPVIDKNDVKWTFEGWDTEDGNIVDKDIEIKGTWKAEQPKTITYKWGDFDPKSNVPEDEKKYHKGNPYEVIDGPVEIGKTFIDDEGNKWTFLGWDTEDGNMGDENIVITGKWSNELPKKVTYEFVGEYPTNYVTLPEDNTKYHTGDPYEVKDDLFPDPIVDGNIRWTFQGWDTEDGTIKDGDITIKGTWLKENIEHIIDFNPVEKPEERFDFPLKDGELLRVVPNGGDWQYQQQTYSGDEKAEIPVVQNMSIPEPSRRGYKFTGWTKSVDNDGVVTLTANWEPDIDCCCLIIPTLIVAGVVAAITAGTAAIIAVAAPVAIIGTIHTVKHVKEKLAEKETVEACDIPATGSMDMIPVYSSLLISAICAAYVIISSKKRKKGSVN